MTIKCFMLEPTDRAKRWLRRYADNGCPNNTGYYHSAVVPGEDALIVSERGGVGVAEFSAGDPRWPTTCACGYSFTAEHPKQTFTERIYLTPEGREVTIHPSPLPGTERAPAGAMFWVDWPYWRGPDGKCLGVVLPDGSVWFIDAPATCCGEPWTRTGSPPNVTVSPRILTPNYHGCLRDGQLVEC